MQFTSNEEYNLSSWRLRASNAQPSGTFAISDNQVNEIYSAFHLAIFSCTCIFFFQETEREKVAFYGLLYNHKSNKS